EDVAALRVERPEIACVVLEVSPVATNAEAHVARRRGDAELGEESDEVRVGARVEDEKARIDRRSIDDDGVRVSAESFLGLEENDLVVLAKSKRRDEPRDACTDDGDLHEVPVFGSSKAWRTSHSLPLAKPKSSAH